MPSVQKFEGRRSRGIVWVCDVANSSKHLNDNRSAEALEKFLQRFLFMSLIFVDAAGGEFIKWTGDGFLAWFETPLHREIGQAASSVFNAAWHLSSFVNVTQLKVESPVKFKIRHAVTFEHDALLMDLAYSRNRSSADVLGRAVVLAFRLSSIAGKFPSIVTQGELIRATKDTGTIHFKKLKFSKEDKLKYFKAETWGSGDVFVSSDRTYGKLKPRSVLAKVRSAITEAEGTGKREPKHLEFQLKLLKEIETCPEWCKSVIDELVNSVQTGLSVLREAVPVLARADSKASS